MIVVKANFKQNLLPVSESLAELFAETNLSTGRIVLNFYFFGCSFSLLLLLLLQQALNLIYISQPFPY